MATIKVKIKRAGLLTVDDLPLIAKLAKAKAAVKKLEDDLKPRIIATGQKYGAGTLEIDGQEIEIKVTVRNTTSWKSLATALLPEKAITEAQPDYTVESTSYRAVIR